MKLFSHIRILSKFSNVMGGTRLSARIVGWHLLIAIIQLSKWYQLRSVELNQLFIYTVLYWGSVKVWVYFQRLLNAARASIYFATFCYSREFIHANFHKRCFTERFTQIMISRPLAKGSISIAPYVNLFTFRKKMWSSILPVISI